MVEAGWVEMEVVGVDILEDEFSGEDEKVCAEFGLLLEVNCEVVVVEKEFWLVLIKDEVCCCWMLDDEGSVVDPCVVLDEKDVDVDNKSVEFSRIFNCKIFLGWFKIPNIISLLIIIYIFKWTWNCDL